MHSLHFLCQTLGNTWEYRAKRDSTTTFSRFQNQNHAIPEPNHANQSRRASTTTFSGFHNQTLTIPQPHSHDSTTKMSRFYNQNVAILQQTTMDSSRNALSVLQTVQGNASTDTSRQKQNDRQHAPSIIQVSMSNLTDTPCLSAGQTTQDRICEEICRSHAR